MGLAVGAFDTPSPTSRLDAFMPAYNFRELHEILIQAPPHRVRAALDRIAWADICDTRAGNHDATS
jgi:hypothetical protein